jgi:hypothetical protein
MNQENEQQTEQQTTTSQPYRTRALLIPEAALLGERWGCYKKRGEPLLARFSRFVSVGAPGTCWMWVGASQKGYPTFTIKGYPHSAHRVAWALSRRKELPAGVRVWTTCRNTLCLNPRHLTLERPRPTKTEVRRALQAERDQVVRAAVAAGIQPASIARVCKLSPHTVRCILQEKAEWQSTE